MRVLVTSAGRELPAAIASALAKKHQVRLTDTRAIPTSLEFVRRDLGHDESTNALVRGIDAIVHSGEADPSLSASRQLDYQMRCTYNLLTAAVQEGVPRFIYLSSLRVMEGYDPDLAVTERWRPRPSTNVESLCYHLGEFVCREFGREGTITVMCLRLGDLATQANPVGPATLLLEDAIQAVERALTAELMTTQTLYPRPGEGIRWGVFHIQSSPPDKRYSTTTAEKILGYQPSSIGQAQP
jgi:nucleoside-diphosphate-sugar epimerase